MNEKGKVLAVLGLVIALEGYIVNEIFMMFARESSYILPPGTVRHSGPPIIATAWIFLVPLGFMIIFISIVLEFIDRRRRIDITEAWE